MILRVRSTMTTIASQAGLSLLEANLEALAIRSPTVAAALRLAPVGPEMGGVGGVEWITTEQEGAPSAILRGRGLASRRRPLEEAEALGRGVDLTKAGCVVVLGFGLGYHIGALAKRAGKHTAVLVYEPDLALLREVFERIDCASWLRRSPVLLFTDAGDGAGVTAAVQGIEPLLALGVTFVEHAPSRSRLGDGGRRFTETVTRVVASIRTQIITTMVQMGVTARNMLMNCDWYARGDGIAELAGLGAGAPAIVVSAGPSLRRNIERLRTPGLRDRCVIIAVQTVLRQLLSMGIRPHFVTALDYHEISARFYEGLSAAAVEGVTLVAEAKANPAILASFPGAIRLVEAEYLDLALGRELASARGPHGALPSGATVAHLAYYLARHLGCDPVILTGQDLAFTDGQYYSAGAAIHDIWAGELNDFNTLEMMEWQRIVRWRGHLHRMTDHLGRPIYTDDQMSAYLAQFERDFRAESQRGRTTIDATEGGVAKAHSRAMPLRDALERYAPPEAAPLPEIPAPEGRLAPSRRRRLRARLERLRLDAAAVGELSDQAAGLLAEMERARGDQAAVNALIDRVQGLRVRVERIEPAYGLVQRLNQAGAFKRLRADRRLELESDLAPLEAQGRRIERDRMNVAWLADVARSLRDLLGDTIAMLDGGPRITSDPAPPGESEVTGESGSAESGSPEPRAPAAARARSVAAVIPVDHERGALGWRRSLADRLGGRNLLRLTLERLARCRSVGRAILVTNHPERTRELVEESGSVIAGLEVEIESAAGASYLERGRSSVAPARLWARSCWRGGLGYATAWDEVFDPRLVAEVMAERRVECALVVGADWSLVDPELCDAVVGRHGESVETTPVAFAHAPPGLAGIALGARIAGEMARGRHAGDPGATIGAMLGFMPTRPRTDPITGRACVQTTPVVRDAPWRFIPDSRSSLAMLARALEGLDPVGASAGAIAVAAGRVMEEIAPGAPERVTLELCVDRALPRLRGRAKREAIEVDRLGAIFEELAREAPECVLTLGGAGDPLLHPRWREVVRRASEAGVAGLHIRTDLVVPPEMIEEILDAAPDVVSVDLHAARSETYAALTGADAMGQALENLDRLARGARERRERGEAPLWIVPRMTRRDAVYEEIEEHFDKGLLITGASVIDPLPEPIAGERIEPFAKPRATARRDRLARMLILCDGSVVADERDARRETPASVVADVFEVGPIEAWRRLMERRFEVMRAHGEDHPDLWTGW